MVKIAKTIMSILTPYLASKTFWLHCLPCKKNISEDGNDLCHLLINT